MSSLSLARDQWPCGSKWCSCSAVLPDSTHFSPFLGLKTLHQNAIQKKTFTMNCRGQSKRQPICRGKLLSAHHGGAGRRCYGATCLTWNWSAVRPGGIWYVRSEDCVGRERKRETSVSSVCICETEKVRDWKLTDQQIPSLQTVQHFSADPLAKGTSIRSNTFGQSINQGGSNKLFQQRLPKPRSIRSAVRFLRKREEKKEENRHARYWARKRQENNHKTIIPSQWPHVTTVEKNFISFWDCGDWPAAEMQMISAKITAEKFCRPFQVQTKNLFSVIGHP